MKKSSFVKASAALALAIGFALPAAAQMTYNFGDGGNCNFPGGNPCTVAGSSTVAANVTISGWAAPSGSNFVAGTLTDQGGSGVGLSFSGETTGSPQHAIDNDGQTELVLLNFGTNRVVVTGIATGWSNTDTDVALLRWTGTNGPTLTSSNVSNLVSSGWQIVASADLDGSAAAISGDIGGRSASNLVTVNTANSSSWWIVSSYFGGGSLGTPDTQKDYFKLLSVSAQCVGNTSGGACNTTPPGGRVPEPASLALAAVALAGLGFTRRKRRA